MKKPTLRRPPTATLRSRKTVLLVDDHPMMRMGMAQLIEGEVDLTVSGQAGNAAEALRLLSQGLPDLVITDLTLPGKGGLELIKDIRVLHPALPILVLSMHDEMLHAERALKAGAKGYVMKEAGGERMLAAVRQVLSGNTYVSERMAAKILDLFTGIRGAGSRTPIESLSDREFEVFELIGHGKTTREIAATLNLSPKTVDVHRGHIKEKLKLGDVTALVRHAVCWVEQQQPSGKPPER